MKFIGKSLIMVGLLLLNMSTISGESKNSSIYKELWEQVEKAEKDRLPQTAQKYVDQIYAKALAESEYQQIIKALIYRMKFTAETDENSDLLFFEQLEEEINNAELPVKNILYSLRAETYWQYYEAHRWDFYDRTETVDYDHKNIRTWDLKTILKETIENYQLSLQDTGKLKKIKIDDFEEILAQGNTRELRPTVYDFLAHRAIDFYANDRSQLIQPAHQFELDSDQYFSSADQFVNLEVSTKDSLSLKFHALMHLQELTRFHLKDKSKAALLDLDLKRVNFVYRNSVVENKVEKYEKALLELLNVYEGSDLQAEIYYPLAILYRDLGSKYVPKDAEEFKWYKKKAYDICLKVLEIFPDTPGAQNCRSLKAELESKNISLQIENVNIPERSILGLSSYKNIDKFHYRIYKTNYREIKNLVHYDRNSILDNFMPRQTIESGIIELPQDGDLNDHSTEIKLPALPQGQYLLLLSYKNDFRAEENCVTYNIIETSNLSCIQRRLTSDQLEFYVMDRVSGKPVPEVTIKAWTNYYNEKQRKYVLKKADEFTTDSQGHIIIDLPVSGVDRNHYFNMELIKNNDNLMLSENFYNYSYNEEDRSYMRTFFFTDRAIYRPGQTVYFKGVVLETDGRENKIRTGFKSRVELIDVNYQKLAELDLVTNEYGTFSGSFVIPQGVLTGNFHISNDLGEHHFSVEEYKRPNFEIIFDPVTESYALGDEVTVTGKAKAYAGFNIDNAELTYRVVRTATFPRWWYFFRRPYNNDTMEIVNGTATTDNEGNFTVQFKAIPDLKIPREDDPAFNYQILVDVTDMNGETRSAQQYVRVGYSLMRLEFAIPEKVDQDLPDHNYAISSLNLNGQYEPAAGTIKIYSLKQPEVIFRRKLWQDPDVKSIDREDYYKSFPGDQYDSELDYYQWEKADLMWEDTFDTEKSKSVDLKKMRKWDPGIYLVETESRDKRGNPVEDKTWFTLFSQSSKELPYKTADWFYAVKSYGEPGESASYLIGSSYNIDLLYEVEFDKEIIERKWLQLNGNQKLIEIPIKEEYRGNFAVHFSFIKENRLYLHSQTITVPWTNKQLAIQFETFRDKLQPGEVEEWKIKITDHLGMLSQPKCWQHFTMHLWMLSAPITGILMLIPTITTDLTGLASKTSTRNTPIKYIITGTNMSPVPV